jgi:HK97 family phage portal protein
MNLHHLASRAIEQTVLRLTAGLARLRNWLGQKTLPAALGGAQWTGTSFTDAYRRNRNPTPNELLAELKGIAWSCASLNAAVCASYPPRVYVTTAANQSAARCPTRPVSRKTLHYLREHPLWSARLRSGATVEEVTDHPLVTLLQQPTPPDISFGSFDLWELTHTYLEVHGVAYWYLEPGPFGVPQWCWLLPAQNVTAERDPESPRMVDYWRYRNGHQEERFAPEEIIFFRYPDPRNPYLGGLSPLRACYEQVNIASHYAARRQAIFENDSVPAALISPDEVIGEEERDRLESQWNQRFRKGGAGKVVVAESSLKVNVLQHSLGDLALLAEQNATKEMIANAFHVPIAFLTSQTNMANLQASVQQHMTQCIGPRLQRRDEKLNELLVPLYDPTGRLFLASEDPVPVDQDAVLQQLQADLNLGILTINEVRSGRGLPAVEWGDLPWLSTRVAQTDVPRTTPAGRAFASDVQHSEAPTVLGTGEDDHA